MHPPRRSTFPAWKQLPSLVHRGALYSVLLVALQRRLTCNTPHLYQTLRPISAFWRGATNKQLSRSLTFGGSIPTSDSNQPVRMPKTPDFFFLFSPFSFSSFDPRRHQRPLTIHIATAFSSSQSPPTAAASLLDTETQ